MGVTGKLEVEVDIKCHGDVFHELFGKKPHHVSKIVPDKIHGCEVHEGEFGKPGSIILWNYTVDGKKCVAKEVVEAIDEEKKSVRFKVIEGDLLKEFKSITFSIHVVPKGQTTAVMWAAEFEKIADDGPYPTKIMDFCIHLTRDIEKHHLKD
ncbi:MLP-like protein 43 [Chenopodium quinoa]|uniref:MLP-like protein 43 n=1 Tax=Chenopodium quinoa TaxID=63459 RepID=UPI000B76F4B2|nr:MLP-like protein 43 [Chenopodium quinoa]